MADSVAHVLEPIELASRFKKNDPDDLRLGDVMQFLEVPTSLEGLKSRLKSHASAGFTLVGYPDDAGIQANGGRVGARLGPGRIRNFLSRMTPPALSTSTAPPALLDLGNIALNDSIGERHERARSVADQVHERGSRVISFGGGHDYGFPDAAAFCRFAMARGERPLVINFDAHLDVRPMNHGITSGTPFFRLLEEFPALDFIEVGLQAQCNSRAHVDWLKARGGRVSFEEERHAAQETLKQVLQRETASLAIALAAGQKRSVFISVDIDAFSSAIAPGASQSWPTGFQAVDFFDGFSWLLKSFDVRGLGIYEVSPPLDVDDRTARLAALIAYRFVFQL